MTNLPAPLRTRNRLPIETSSTGLAQPLLVEEAVSRSFVLRTGYLLSIGTLALVVWAGVTPVNEVSRATGAIIPSGYERVIQHLEGGIVRQIFVEAGDVVSEGDPLFLIDDARTTQDLATLRARRADLQAQIETQTALIEGEQPDFTDVETSDGNFADLSQTTYLAQRDARTSRMALLESQITQARAAQQASEAQIEGQNMSLLFAQRDRDRIKTLADRGFAARAELDARETRVAEIQSQINVTTRRLEAARADVEEAERALAAFIAEIRSAYSGRLQELAVALAEVESELDKANGRGERMTVTAPTDGVIKSLEVNTLGSVIQRGQLLGTLVPMSDRLVAETRLPASEIGHVGIGMRALIKLTAYDFSRYGWIEGRVSSISPSAFTSPEGRSYFSVRVELQSDTPTNAPNAEVIPGMDVAVEVITGQRSILEYVLTPIRTTLASAFQER